MNKRNEAPTSCKTNGLVQLPWHNPFDIAVEAERLVLIAGRPGEGKSKKAAHRALADTGRPPLVLSGSPECEQAHLWGRWSLTGEGTRFVDGPLPASLKSFQSGAGRYLLVEEYSLLPLEVRAEMLPLRDQNEITNPLTGEVIPIHPGWRAIFTSNLENLSACRKNHGIAQALFSGVTIVMSQELGDQHILDFLRVDFPGSAPEQRQRTLALYNEWRDLTHSGSSGKEYLTYRSAASLLNLILHGMSEFRAVEIALINKFLPSDPDLHGTAMLKHSLGEPEPSSSRNGKAPDDEL